MDYILDLLLKQIFGQPFLLLAIVVFIGYIAMKQTVGKAIIGAFKASCSSECYRHSGSRTEYLSYHDGQL